MVLNGTELEALVQQAIYRMVLNGTGWYLITIRLSRRSARRLDVAGRIKTLRVVVQRLQSYQDGTMQKVSISED